jgi:hypothetical protein
MGRTLYREPDIPSDPLEAIHVYMIRVLNTVCNDVGGKRFYESSVYLTRNQDATARNS